MYSTQLLSKSEADETSSSSCLCLDPDKVDVVFADDGEVVDLELVDDGEVVDLALADDVGMVVLGLALADGEGRGVVTLLLLL